MSETVKENIAKTVLLFIKNNLALLSAFIFLCFSLFDLYVFKETFHMNGAVFFNRVLPNAFGSFSQFWPYLFLPIVKVIFTLGFFYALQFFFLDIVFKFIKNRIERNETVGIKHKTISILGALFADVFLLWVLQKIYIDSPLSLFLSLSLVYAFLIINNLFTMAVISHYILTSRHDKKSFYLIFGLLLFVYFGLKVIILVILIHFGFDFIGIYVVFNAFFFIFFFLFGVLAFNNVDMLKINKELNTKNNLSELAHKRLVQFIILPAILLLFFSSQIDNIHTIPYQKKDFWANFEKKDTTLPRENPSNLFSPAKIERMSEENKYNFSPVQQKRITEKYKNAFGEENNFFDQNLTHFSIPHGEKALIFLFNGEHVISVYAHADELTNEVKKIYDVGYVEIKP